MWPVSRRIVAPGCPRQNDTRRHHPLQIKASRIEAAIDSQRPAAAGRLDAPVRQFRQLSGRVLAAVLHPDIGELGMLGAVRLSGHRLLVAEVETPWCRARRSASSRAADAPSRCAAARSDAARRAASRRPGSARAAIATGRGSEGIAARSGGSVGPTTRRTAGRRGAEPGSPRRIGDGRADKFSRCALPTTAFFDTPIRRPISAVECPSDQSALSWAIVSSLHSMSWSPPSTTTTYGRRKANRPLNSAEGPICRILWKTAVDPQHLERVRTSRAPGAASGSGPAQPWRAAVVSRLAGGATSGPAIVPLGRSALASIEASGGRPPCSS